MAMQIRLRLFNFIAIGLLLLTINHEAHALVANPASYPKALSDLKEAIVKGLGFKGDDFKISGFDLSDALVGKSVAYEFDVEIDNQILPLKLLEDVNKWEYVDLPIFHVKDHVSPKDQNGLVDKQKMDHQIPILAPFQLAGPMELWIQDAKDMRLSLPHDVDAGELRKVMLADGAVVTVKGARSVSMRHPIELPLPLNRTNDGFASGILALAEHLRHASRTQENPLLSLRIVGPTSLESPRETPSNKLKLKRLAPGLVELSSVAKRNKEISVPNFQESTALLTPNRFTTMWPIASINGSNSNLLGFESLLASVLGKKADKKGSIKLLKADVSAQTFVKIGFGVEKKLKGDEFSSLSFPEWRTKPENVRMHFEVLAKVEGDKVVPERIIPIEPVRVEDIVERSVLTGNVSMSSTPLVYPPPNPFTL